ncbi:MAG: 1-deoxy-D-xylulose-5-phosphate reductoisomerase, partial [Candidatus Competibacteraceae bacterium]
GGTAPPILNAGNEVAVQAFLEQRIRFTPIAAVVEQTLERVSGRAAETLAVILDDDARARAVAGEQVAARAVEG